ncbi:unnamed protein product, partial [Sphacelaria rigidula]
SNIPRFRRHSLGCVRRRQQPAERVICLDPCSPACTKPTVHHYRLQGGSPSDQLAAGVTSRHGLTSTLIPTYIIHGAVALCIVNSGEATTRARAFNGTLSLLLLPPSHVLGTNTDGLLG